MVLSMPFSTSTTPGILLMASPTLGAELREQLGIVGKELDLDWLRRIRQIADHVLQHLRELDVQLRLGGLDLLANVFHHLVDADGCALPSASR